MTYLELRPEFLGAQTPGTTIDLQSRVSQGNPDEILAITYPTADVQSALHAISKAQSERPIVLTGGRGSGKSHIMTVIHYAFAYPDEVETWAYFWAQQTAHVPLNQLQLQRGYLPISEKVLNNEYLLLWDILFERHPHGERYRGKLQALGKVFPPRSLLEDMLTEQPVALILDELQTWYNGLYDEPATTGKKYRSWAFGFIQLLSELAVEKPQLLILVGSVLDNDSDAFRQIHRNGPILIDFRGPTARQDRQRMVLHRIFTNRQTVPDNDILQRVSAYADERFRLKFAHASDAERMTKAAEVVACWPFSPELLDLLDNHILMSETAQESRDLIRVLVQVYRARGSQVPIITPADFLVDDDGCGVQSLLDSISTTSIQGKLRGIAQTNLKELRDAGIQVENDRELISALWMRSMSPYKNPGATTQDLQLDVTRDMPLDDNAFQVELTRLVTYSINIHGGEQPGDKFCFGIEENPRTRVRSVARNEKFWQTGAGETTEVQGSYPGQDIAHIRDTIKHLFSPETQQTTRVIVLGPDWEQNPWSEVEDADKPERWEFPVLLVLPVAIAAAGSATIPTLGNWLVNHVPKNRNMVRFLLPKTDSKGLYEDSDLLFSARCSYLTTIAWRKDSQYAALHKEFNNPLRTTLKGWFDRFAVLQRWNYQQPVACVFDTERVSTQGDPLPAAIEKEIVRNLFDPTEFRQYVEGFANNSRTVGELLDDMREPPGQNMDTIPFLGDTAIFEKLLELVASGWMWLNVDGTRYGRLPEHSSDQEALQSLRSNAKVFRTGNERRRMVLEPSSAAGGSTVTGQTPQPQTTVPAQPTVPPPGTVQETVYPSPVVASNTPSGSSIGTARTTNLAINEDRPELSPVPAANPLSGSIPFPTEAGEEQTPAAGVPRQQTQRSNEPGTGINLSSSFERWDIPSDTVLSNAKIEFTDVSVAQMKQILQRLPSALRAILEVSYSEENIS